MAATPGISSGNHDPADGLLLENERPSMEAGVVER